MISTLSRRTRLRLWRNRHIDNTAIWLIEHHHTSTAIALWRVTGLWKELR